MLYLSIMILQRLISLYLIQELYSILSCAAAHGQNLKSFPVKYSAICTRGKRTLYKCKWKGIIFPFIFHDLIFLCISFYTGHYYWQEYCLVLGVCTCVHQEKESQDTTLKNSIVKIGSYFRKILVLDNGKNFLWEKYNHFLYKQNSNFCFGAFFLIAFSNKRSHWNICLLVLFSPQLFPQQLFPICRQKKVHSFGQIKRGDCCQILRSAIWYPNILFWKVPLAELENLTIKNLQPQLLSPSNGYYWTLLLSKTNSKYFPLAFFSMNCKTAAT